MGGTLSLEQQAHDGLLSSQEKKAAISTFIRKVGDTPDKLRNLNIKTSKKTCISILDHLSSTLTEGSTSAYIEIVDIMKVLQRLLQLEGFYQNMIKLESFEPIIKALSLTNDDVVEETLKVIHLMITCQLACRIQPSCGGKDLKDDKTEKTSKNDVKISEMESEMKRILYEDNLAAALSDLFDRYYSISIRSPQVVRIITEILRAFHLPMAFTIHTSTYKQILASITALSNSHECIIELTIDLDPTTREHATRLLIALLLHSNAAETKKLQMFIMEHGKLLWYVYIATRKDDIEGHAQWDIAGQHDLYARLVGYLSDGNEQVTRVLHRTIPKHLYDNAKAGSTKLEFAITRAYSYDLTKDEEKSYHASQFYLYHQDKLRHGDWVSVFEEINLPHTHPLLVWDKTNKEELIYSLLGEIYDYNTQVDVNGTATWDHEGFEVDYTSLSRFLKVGRYYVHLLLPHFEKRMQDEQDRLSRGAITRDKSSPPPPLDNAQSVQSPTNTANGSDTSNGDTPVTKIRQIGMRQRGGEGTTTPVMPSKQNLKKNVDPYNVPISDLHSLISSCFQRAVVEDNVGWKLGCLRMMSSLYANYPRVLQEADMMPYLIWLLTPKTDQGTLLDMNVVVEVINGEIDGTPSNNKNVNSSSTTAIAEQPSPDGVTPADHAASVLGVSHEIAINTGDDDEAIDPSERDRILNSTISPSELRIENQIFSAMNSSFNNPLWRDHILKFLNQLFDHTTNINRFVASDGINSLLYYINDIHRVSHAEVVRKYQKLDGTTTSVAGKNVTNTPTTNNNTLSPPAPPTSNAPRPPNAAQQQGASSSTTLHPPKSPSNQPTPHPTNHHLPRFSVGPASASSLPLHRTGSGGSDTVQNAPPDSITSPMSLTAQSHVSNNAIVVDLLKCNRNRRPIYEKIDLLTGVPGPDSHLEVARKCLLLLKKIVKNASRLRKRIFKRRVLVTLVQLLLVEDAEIVNHSLETLMILIDANSHVIPNLARTGVFEFIIYAIRNNNKCSETMATFIDKYHLKQGADFTTSRGASVYQPLFPDPLINLSLQPQGGKQLARVVDNTIVNHLLVWDNDCKRTLSDSISALVEPFVLKLSQCPFSNYRYVPPKKVQYSDIERELFVGSVYVRLFNLYSDALNRNIYMKPTIDSIHYPHLNDPYMFFISLNKEFKRDKYYTHRKLTIVDSFKSLGPVVPIKNPSIGSSKTKDRNDARAQGSNGTNYGNFIKEFDHKARIQWPPVQQQVSDATYAQGSAASPYTAGGGTPRASSVVATTTLTPLAVSTPSAASTTMARFGANPGNADDGAKGAHGSAVTASEQPDVQSDERNKANDRHLIQLLQAKATLAGVLPTNDEIFNYQSTQYLVALISTIDGPYDASNELLCVSIRLLRALLVLPGSTNPQSFVEHGGLTMITKLIVFIGQHIADIFTQDLISPSQQDSIDLLTQCVNIFNALLTNGKNRYHPCTYMYQLSCLLHQTDLFTSFFLIVTTILNNAQHPGREWLVGATLRLLLSFSNIDEELKQFHMVNDPLLDFFDKHQRITPHRYFLQHGIVLDTLRLALFHTTTPTKAIDPPHCTDDGVLYSNIHAANLYRQFTASPAEIKSEREVKKLQRTSNTASRSLLLDDHNDSQKTRNSRASRGATGLNKSAIREDDRENEISRSMIPSDLRHETAPNLQTMAMLAGSSMADFGDNEMLKNTLKTMKLYDQSTGDTITPTLKYSYSYSSHKYIPCTQTFPNENGIAIRKDAIILIISMCHNELKTIQSNPPCFHSNTFYDIDKDDGDRLSINDKPHESLPNHDHNINYYIYEAVSRLLTPGIMFNMSQLVPLLTVGASNAITTVATTTSALSGDSTTSSAAENTAAAAAATAASDESTKKIDHQLSIVIKLVESNTESPMLIWNDQTRNGARVFIDEQLSQRQQSPQRYWDWGKQAVERADQFYKYLMALSDDSQNAMFLEDVLETSTFQEEQQKMYNARLSRRESARPPANDPPLPSNNSTSPSPTTGPRNSGSLVGRKSVFAPPSLTLNPSTASAPASSSLRRSVVSPSNGGGSATPTAAASEPTPPPTLDFPYTAEPVKNEVIVQGIFVRLLLKQYEDAAPREDPSKSSIQLPSPWSINSLFEAVSRAIHRHCLSASDPAFSHEFHTASNRCLHDGEISTSYDVGSVTHGCALTHDGRVLDLTASVRHQLLTVMNIIGENGNPTLRGRLQMLANVLLYLSQDITCKLDTFTLNPRSGVVNMLNLLIRGNPYHEQAVLEVLYILQTPTTCLSIPRLSRPESTELPSKNTISINAHHVVITAVHYLNLILMRESATPLAGAAGNGSKSPSSNSPTNGKDGVPRPANPMYISSSTVQKNPAPRKPSLAPPPHMQSLRKNAIEQRGNEPIAHPLRPGVMLCLNILHNLIAGEFVLRQGRVIESLWTNGITTTLMKIITHPSAQATNALGAVIVDEKLPLLSTFCRETVGTTLSAEIDTHINGANQFTTAHRIFAAKMLGMLSSHDIAGPYFVKCLQVLLAPWFKGYVINSTMYPIDFIEAFYSTYSSPDKIWNSTTRKEMITFLSAECKLIAEHIVTTTTNFAETAYREIRMTECEQEIQEYITVSRQQEVSEEEIEKYSRLLESQYHDIITETLKKGEVLDLVILPQVKFEPYQFPPSTWVERFDQSHLSEQIYIDLNDTEGVYLVPLLERLDTFDISDSDVFMSSLTSKMSDAMFKVLWLKNHAKETNVAYEEAKEAGYFDDDGNKLTVDIIVEAQVREFEKARELNRLLGVSSSTQSTSTHSHSQSQSRIEYDDDDDDDEEEESLDVDELRLQAEALLADVPTSQDLDLIYKAIYQSTQALEVMLRAIQAYTDRQPSLLNLVISDDVLAKLGEFLVIESENEWLNYVIVESVPQFASFRDGNVNVLIRAVLKLLGSFNQPHHVALLYKHKLVRCLLPLLHLYHDHFLMEDENGQQVPATCQPVLDGVIDLIEMMTRHHPQLLPDMINMGGIIYYLNLILQAKFLPEAFVNRLLIGIRLMAMYDVKSRIEVLQFLACEFKDFLISQQEEDFEAFRSMLFEDLPTCILCGRRWGSETREILLDLFKTILPSLTTKVMVWTVGSGMVYDRTAINEVLTPYDEDTLALLRENDNHTGSEVSEHHHDTMEATSQQRADTNHDIDQSSTRVTGGSGGVADEALSQPAESSPSPQQDAAGDSTSNEQPAPQSPSTDSAKPEQEPPAPSPTKTPPRQPHPSPTPPPAAATQPPAKPSPTPPVAAPTKPAPSATPPQPPQKPAPSVNRQPSAEPTKSSPSQQTSRLSSSNDLPRSESRQSITQQYGAVPKNQPSSKMAALAARFEQPPK